MVGNVNQVGQKGWRIESVWQFQVVLAYAVTCHKSQGLTLSSAVVFCSREYVPGLIHVAILRVKSPEHIRIVNFTVNALHAWTLGNVRFQYSGEWFVNEFDWHAFPTRLKDKDHISNNWIIQLKISRPNDWKWRKFLKKDKDLGQQQRSCICWANTNLSKQNA